MASKYDEMIKKAIERVVADGYEFLEKGMGDYRELEKDYRAKGYVTYGCFTVMSRNMSKRQYVLYGRMKKTRSSKNVVTDPTTTQPTKSSDEIRAELESKNVKALRDMCKSSLIKGYGKMNKDQMIEAIMKGMK